MIDSSEKHNRQLAFELQNLHVCEKRGNMSHQKHVWRLESFFTPNRSQSESEKNDTVEEQCINQEETNEDRKKPKKITNFPENLVTDHTRLRYEKEVMFCYFCQKSKTNSFASAKGCTNFRTSTLHRHKDCKEHEDAVNEEAMRDTFNNTQHHVFRAQSQVILTAMRAVYWLAKEDVATVKYNSLLNFLMKLASNKSSSGRKCSKIISSKCWRYARCYCYSSKV